MKTIVLLGAGKIGRMVAHFLGTCGDYALRVADGDAAAVERLVRRHGGVATGAPIDFKDQRALDAALDGAAAVISCAPFHCNPLIAERAREQGLHYLDLTEDVAVTDRIETLADGAEVAFVPQCGLAPGFITIAATHLMRGLDEVHDLRLRVGALPRFPTNRLKYNLTWSTEGLVNEYLHPCEAVVGGELVRLPALENLERLMIDGVEYEAFNTSGGLATLAETLKGRVRNLDYKSVRYPGHNELVKFLLHDLKLAQRPEVMRELLERAIPATELDQVVILVSATGLAGGALTERTFARTVRHQELDGAAWTAIQITTAAGVCAVLDLLFEGALPDRGFVRQEQVDFDLFVANRFGRHFA